MPTATRRRAAFDLAAYESEVAEFVAAREDALYQQQAGFTPDLDLDLLYARHGSLFDRAAVDELRSRSGRASQVRERLLLAFATDGHLERDVAPLTEAIAHAQATAVIMWRGRPVPYRAVMNLIADTSSRRDRYALLNSLMEAEEAINPLRARRLERMAELSRELGYRDYVDLVAQTRGYDPDALVAPLRDFLDASETVFFSSLRRHLARIEIEQGDANLADAAYLFRGIGWDSWFDAARLTAVLESTVAGMGLDLGLDRGGTLDLARRPNKSPRAFVASVRVPQDIRLVIQPHGGWDDYAAALHEAGHLLHLLGVDPDLPAAVRVLGDPTLTEAQAFLFEDLAGDPEWLARQLRIPADTAAAFADFFALWRLRSMRMAAASVLSQLRLHRTSDAGVQRADYAGLVGLLGGVTEPDARYLEAVDDGLYAASYARAFMLRGALADFLAERNGSGWWSSPGAGRDLQAIWRRGFAQSPEDAVASLGYDRLDWRPVLRQISASLIGEMSGYGGPNITTRAGTRKI